MSFLANHYYTKANEYANNQQYDKAIEYYTKALSHNPSKDLQESIYYGMGVSYHNSGNIGQNYDEALRYYKEAYVLNPNDDQIYFNRARILEEQGKHEAAIEQYNAGLRVGKGIEQYQLADYLAERGVALYNNGQCREAVQDFTTALQYNPNQAQAIRYLEPAQQAQNYAQQNRQRQVPDLDVYANPKPPRSIAEYYLRACQNYRDQRYHSAAGYFKVVADSNQNNREWALANYYLGIMHEKGEGVEKNIATAASYYAIAFQYFNQHIADNWSYYLLAEMYQYGRGVPPHPKNAETAAMMMRGLAQKTNLDPLLRETLKDHLNELEKGNFATVKFYLPDLNLPPSQMQPKPTYYGSYGSSPNPYTSFNGYAGSRNNAMPQVEEVQSKKHFTFLDKLRY